MIRGGCSRASTVAVGRKRGTPKALLPWRGSTLLDFALSEARLAGVDDFKAVFLGHGVKLLKQA